MKQNYLNLEIIKNSKKNLIFLYNNRETRFNSQEVKIRKMKNTILTAILIFISIIISAQQQPIPTIPLTTPKSQGTIDFRMDDMSIFAQTKIVQLENLSASEIEPFLRPRLSQFGSVQINDSENLVIITDREPKLTDLVELVKKLDKIGKKGFLRLETAIIPVQFMKASKVIGIAQQRLSLEGTVQADDDTNIIILTDVKSKIEQFKEIIKSIDIPPKQIVVEARIIETKHAKGKSVGIDWGAFFNKANMYLDYVNQGYKTRDILENPDTRTGIGLETNQERRSITTAISVPVSNLDTILKLLDEKGDIKLLATQSIITLNNRDGEFFSGIIKEYGAYKTGFRLRVTPVIGASDMIMLSITAGVGELIELPNSYYGLTNEQTSTSSVLVKSGETFILSGLKRKYNDKIIKRVPILGYLLPGIFSSSVNIEQESEFTIFITPQIVKVAQATDEELKKLEK